MELGTFSVSLAVKDMTASRDFYEKLGFTTVAGDGETWTIVTNGANAIGLFQGMLDSNILTFNPGWEPRPASQRVHRRSRTQRIPCSEWPCAHRRHDCRDTDWACEFQGH